MNNLICGDIDDVIKNFDNDSIDSIITDPPYGYSFMNKDWDKAVIGVDTWKEVLRVLKPGSFAAIMSSPRQDVLAKMIVNLQDAGFRTDFTSIYWTYACLSEDTEVLTEDGWERFNKSNRFINKSILCYDVINDRYFYEQPESWHYYNVREYMYRIRSDETDQLVSRNHRVFTQKGFIQAEKLQEQEGIAYLSELPKGILHLSSVVKNRESWSLLFHKLQTESKHTEISSSQWETCSYHDGQKKTRTERSNDGRKESGLEGWSNLLQNSWQLQGCEIYPMSKGIPYDVKERWLCNGTQNTSSSTNWQTISKNGDSSSYRSQSNQQFFGQLDALCEQPTSQEIRAFPRSYRTIMATITKEYYEGVIFCPTISSGCFVARRNGKIFLTGNSGFPKAANVSKLVDKRGGATLIGFGKLIEKRRIELGLTKTQLAEHFKTSPERINHGGCVTNWEVGHIPTIEQYNKLIQILKLDKSLYPELQELEREIIGEYIAPDGNKRYTNKGATSLYHKEYTEDFKHQITKPATDKAKELDGSYAGFQPKPALEICLIVMKPLSEKTYVDQALANGKGITWLDKVRIPFQDDKDIWNEHNACNFTGSNNNRQTDGSLEWNKQPNNKGRFPANLLVSDDILNDGKVYKSGDQNGYLRPDNLQPDFKRFKNIGEQKKFWKGDSGSYSRYFDLDKWFETTFPFIITPKASTTEKNRGLDKWIEQKVNDGRKTEIDNPFQRGETLRKNIHPTCKPIKLMSYLISLFTRERDIVLDPFCGSGTTCLAAKLLNRKWIGIDINQEYVDIANKRLLSIRLKEDVKTIS